MGIQVSDAVLEGIKSAVSGPLAGMRYQLRLFGSRVKGSSSSRSDYDLAIDTGAKIDFATMDRIRERLDVLPVLQKIDLVDLKAVSSDFAEAVIREAVVLDER